MTDARASDISKQFGVKTQRELTTPSRLADISHSDQVRSEKEIAPREVSLVSMSSTEHSVPPPTPER